MAVIVDFNAGRHRPSRGPVVPDNGARILFFTGVRYERALDGGEVGKSSLPPPVHAEAQARAASGVPCAAH